MSPRSRRAPPVDRPPRTTRSAPRPASSSGPRTAIRPASECVDIRDRGSKTIVTFELTIQQNREGLAAARRAADALRGVWPELDFTPAPDPGVDLRPRGFLARLFGR